MIRFSRHPNVFQMLVLMVVAMVVAAQGRPALAENEPAALTYPDLVHRMLDLDQLAILPAAGEKCAQWSSYNRRSKYDAENDRYVEWDYNVDSYGYLRQKEGVVGEGEQKEGVRVLADIKGPGVIWRIWSAYPFGGHVKFYLDGAETPAVDLPFNGFFGAGPAPFNLPGLCYMTDARGDNCYVPISFQKSCRIESDPKYGAYYHFTYSQFPTGTTLPTFALPLRDKDLNALKQANNFFTERLGSDPKSDRTGAKTLTKTMTLKPGTRVTLADLEGPRMITQLRVKPPSGLSREEMSDLLRRIALQMTWDDQEKPAVWTPLGDFFGTAPGANRYQSLPSGFVDGEFYAYWRMPFGSRAKIELICEQAKAESFDVSLTHVPLPKPHDQWGRFHAKWHGDAFLPERKDRAIDWTMLKTEGRGRYCGAMLHIWNLTGHWWGEGDEKFFVDGEKFPSTFGTGSEDYFGYAWGMPNYFSRPFHGQTFCSSGNNGHISVYRWHLGDNIPFQKSFEGAIEKYHLNDGEDGVCLYRAITFWYLQPDAQDSYGPTGVEERTGYYDYIRKELSGANFEVTPIDLSLWSKTGGRPGMAREEDKAVKYFYWFDMTKGNAIDLLLPPLAENGTWDLKVRFAGDPKGGTVSLYLDDKLLKSGLDTRAENHADIKSFSLGKASLSKGDHHLRVEAESDGIFAFEGLEFHASE